MASKTGTEKKPVTGLYVPPPRRNLQTFETSMNSREEVCISSKTEVTEGVPRGRGFLSESSRRSGPYSHLSSSSSPPSSLKRQPGASPDAPSVIKDDMIKGTRKIEDFDLYGDTSKCTIYICGISTDLSEIQRGNIITSHITHGALSKWTSPSEAIIVFPTVNSANLAMRSPRSSSYEIYILENIPDQSSVERLTIVARELLKQLKPETNVKVANRLISSHLGFQPKRNQKTSETDISTTNSMGAWDD